MENCNLRILRRVYSEQNDGKLKRSLSVSISNSVMDNVQTMVRGEQPNVTWGDMSIITDMSLRLAIALLHPDGAPYTVAKELKMALSPQGRQQVEERLKAMLQEIESV